MLHELLLALVGCTGDVFMDVKEQAVALGLSLRTKARFNEDNGVGETGSDAFGNVADECVFCVAPDITFFMDSEREVLGRLLHLGFYYKELDNFCENCRNLSWINSKQQPGSPVRQQSVYCRALAIGIAEVLAVYRSAVLEVEQNFMADPVPVLATVTQGLHQFELLLAPLYALIREVEQEQLRGGRLLNLLYSKCHCGIPELQACMQRLLWHGHQVMYRQLSTWMVYGLLQDQHQEFYVRRQQPAEGLLCGDQATEEARLADWHSGFCVNLEMLPEYISLEVAESILFVGKALRVLRNPSMTFKSQVSGSQRSSSKVSNRADDSTGKYFLPPIGGYQGPELLPPAEADTIASMLRDLKKSPDFHKLTFERAVDSIRTIAAIHLWKLVVVHADLIGHLKALKDYFLLAKGDFFQCFLEESRGLMRFPPRLSTAEADLKVPFQQAAVKTIGDDDKYFNRVSLRMPTPAGNIEADTKRTRPITDGPRYGESVPYDGWDGLALEYFIDWPLQLLFTKDILAK